MHPLHHLPSIAILRLAAADGRHSLGHAGDQVSPDLGLRFPHVRHHRGGGRGRLLCHEGARCR